MSHTHTHTNTHTHKHTHTYTHTHTHTRGRERRGLHLAGRQVDKGQNFQAVHIVLMSIKGIVGIKLQN